MSFLNNLSITQKVIGGTIIAAVTVGVIFGVQGLSGTKKNNEVIEHNPAFDQYVTAYTDGEISRSTPIIVRFSEKAVELDQVEKEIDNPFSFEPDINGKAVWKDTRTLQFNSDGLLDPNTLYTASLPLDDYIEDIPDSLSEFVFQFKTLAQSFDVEIDGVITIDEMALKWQRISGTLTTGDIALTSEVEKILKANQDGKSLSIKWTHTEESNIHPFMIDSIARGESAKTILLEWDGEAINVDKKGKRALDIRPIGDFSHVANYTYNSPEQYVALEFSDPLKPDQNLDGLIKLGNYKCDLVVDRNRIKVFPQSRVTGSTELQLFNGVQNVLGYKTNSAFKTTVLFEEINPEVRIPSKGTIIPAGESVPFVFEAVNLKAVDVQIVKIYEDNIPQFLQVNSLEGSRELKRVGRIVTSKKISLERAKNIDLKSWNKHVLDLADLVKQEPGAIYQVSLGFRKSYSLYHCDGADEEGERQTLGDTQNWDGPDQHYEDSNWDYYDDYYDYDYSERSDPCYLAYFHSGRVKKKNVLASSLGLIAKKQTDGQVLVTCVDINSTAPQEGVGFELLDYQQKVIASGLTDSKGQAKVNPSGVPFLLVASKGLQKGYLRLDDGSSLSLSRFDVAGASYHKGLKGFIYGERGVWRPGDTLFLSFMLEDKLGTLPSEHPVEFEFVNPMGQSITKRITTDGLNGVYAFPVWTGSDAVTGNYTAKVSVGGATFRKTCKVETIMPNRLKILLDFDAKYLSASTWSKKAKMTVKWLHGAIASNLKAEVEVILTQTKTTFKTYSDYVFDDPYLKFNTESKTLFDGTLDENGTTEIQAKLSAENESPGMLTAFFKTKVFEPGGNFSVDRFSVPYYPYNTYVGLKLPKGDATRGMLLTDKNHSVDVVALNTDGKLEGSRAVEMELYKVSWKWWWNKSEDYIYDYYSRNHSKALQRETVYTSNGKANWKLRVNYPDWGRYLVRACDEDGHCTGKIVYIDWPGWAGRAQKNNPGGASMLMFTADKAEYKVGENITLNIPSSEGGRALVSIESGDEVLETYWVETEKGTTRFSFQATKDMAPNVYANITMLQPHAQTKNDLPLRLYGILPIKVEDPNTRLEPVLTMPDVLRPESEVLVKVGEANNRPMTYTLAMVDEGLLDLTRFTTPDAWAAFYKRQALGIKTWDLFDAVIGADGSVIKSLLSIGGGADGGDGDGKKANRFKPMVRFLGPFHLNDGETKTHKIQMPNYVGSVKTMVVGGYDLAYGSQEKVTPVRKPLMVLGTLPRVLGPGESLNFPITVFAMDKSIKNVKVEVVGDKRVVVNGPRSKTVSFSKTGDKLVSFNLDVKKSIGVSKVKVIATSGSEKATFETEIDVRNPNPVVKEMQQSEVRGGSSSTFSYDAVGMVGTNRTYLEASVVPPLNMGDRLNYLIRYPYGCVEQTTSSVFPQLYLTKIMKVDKKQSEKIAHNIKAGIQRLKMFQVHDGGFAYWPGYGNSNEWGSNYAGHFLLEAKAAGYAVSADLLAKWVNYQQNRSSNWVPSSSEDGLTQAYRIYLLALNNTPDLGAMNRMRNESGLSTTAKWYLASAYHLAGQKDVASQMTSTLSMTLSPYKELSGTFGSDTRDMAIILQSMSILKKTGKAAQMAKSLSQRMSSDQWHSTQTTAYSLVALAKYAQLAGSGKSMSFKYKTGKEGWKTVSSSDPIWQTDFAITASSGKSIEVENSGGGIIYLQMITEGIPLEGDQTDASNNLSITVKYMDMEGIAINPAHIAQGTDFQAEVTVTNPSDRSYSEMVVDQIFPSGWEIHNTRMDHSSNQAGADKPDYIDIRDDRVYTFYNLTRGESKTFRTLLNASYQGKYYLPTISSSAMYDNSISAHKHGRWVEVLSDGSGEQ